MVLRIKCKCGKSLKIPHTLAGKKIACPGCKKTFSISLEKFQAAAAKIRSTRQTSAPAKTPTPAPLPVPCELDDAPAELDLGLPTEYDVNDASSGSVPSHPTVIPGTPAGAPAAIATAPKGLVCPSCGKEFPANGKICVSCGINLKTGRSILTSDDGHIDAAYEAAEKIIGAVSWLTWIGILPVASEAFGTRKPYAVRGIAIVTVLISAWFLAYDWSDSPKMQSYKNLMLWSGDAAPRPAQLMALYSTTSYGDSEAFFTKLQQMEDEEEEGATEDKEPSAPEASKKVKLSNAQMILAAHNSLNPEQRCIGEFHWYQLITNAFLHGGIMHLIGNLLFLFIFGSRVNALIGNVQTLILYPILAIAGSVGHMMSAAGEPPSPLLGASGAIMGLAGMYLILFPVHLVHVAAYIRMGLWGGFRLHMKLFALRGFWVVLFYISLDVTFTILQLKDGVAHWAHLGGFITGVCLALLLLVTRLINARGGDLLSVILGPRAWALVGKPNRKAAVPVSAA